MNDQIWWWVLGASLVAFLTKLAGYLVPGEWLERPRVRLTMTATTIGLLSALIWLNALENDGALRVDARLAALLAALVALKLRAPFLVVVLVGAATAAVLRQFGLG